MSTKTIAVDSRVYKRLAEARREGESFSKAIDRLLREAAAVHTGGDILGKLAQIDPLSAEEAEALLAVVAENRADEEWDDRDLR
jgi:predicted CopG family antitoxin